MTDFTDNSTPRQFSFEGALVVSQEDRYEIIERLSVKPQEVALTFAKTFVGLPLLLFGPLILITLLMKILQSFGCDIHPGSTLFTVFLCSCFAALANFLFQSVRVIRRARGWQPRV